MADNSHTACGRLAERAQIIVCCFEDESLGILGTGLQRDFTANSKIRLVPEFKAPVSDNHTNRDAVIFHVIIHSLNCFIFLSASKL